MANCNRQQLNITCGTDVVLHDRLIFDGETFDPNLSVGIAANLVSSLGKRTALDVQVVDDELLISVPWIDGTLPGCYGLEVTGSCNSKKWATYADSLIRYTKATVPGESEVTIESDTYDITQEVAYCYSNSPVTFAEVTVDDGYGTPSVDVTYEQRVLSMAFHNLKGNGITDIEVDEQVGDDAVNTVTIKTDADQEGTEFQVRNGSRGNGIASSSESLSDQDGGVNTFTIIDDDGNEHVFHSKNGTKGATGDTGIYNPDAPDAPDFVMANTTGDSTTKAMTQKAVTDELLYDFSHEVNFGDYTSVHAYIYKANNGQVQWRDDSSNYCYFIPVTPGSFIKLVDRGANELGYQWCFLSTDEWTDFGTVTTAVESGDGNNWTSETRIFCVPQGAAFLYVRHKAGGTVITPYTFIGVKIKEKIEELESQTSESLNSLSDSLDTTNENVSANRAKAESDLHSHSIYDWVGDAVSIPTAHNQYVSTVDGEWKQGPANGKSVLIPVTPGDTLRVAPRIDDSGEELVPIAYVVFFVTDGNYYNSGYPAYASGWSFPGEINYEQILVVPDDATHLYVWTRDSNQISRTPSIFRLVGQNEKISKLSSDLDDGNNKLLQEIRNAAVGHNYPMSAKQTNLSFSDGTVVYNSSANYGIYYSLAPLKKGDLVYVYGTSVNARNQYYAFTPVDPSTLETLEGLAYDNFSAFGSSYTHEHVLVVPYDGAYLLRFQAYAFDMDIYKIPFGYDRGRGNDAASQVGGYLYLKRMVNNHRKNGNVAVLLYFSDPHNAVSALAQAAQIKSSVPGIDDVLCGGDNVNDQPNDDYPFFHESLGGKGRTMLTVVGNHDVQSLSQKEVYDIYFGEHTQSWSGVTFPEDAAADGKCYWYKDYAPAKVRLIGLDCINLINDSTKRASEVSWLEGVLADAIANNYHVVICMHYQCYHFQGKRDCNWNSFKSVDGSSSYAASQISSTVQAAIDNGLKFVCYLSGHHHRDYFGFSADYPNQGMFGTDKPTPGGNYNDADREAAACYYSVKDREHWCFNLISINTTYGIMVIDRIGNNRDMLGRPMNHLTYDYINSVIIEQS